MRAIRNLASGIARVWLIGIVLLGIGGSILASNPQLLVPEEAIADAVGVEKKDQEAIVQDAMRDGAKLRAEAQRAEQMAEDGWGDEAY